MSTDTLFYPLLPMPSRKRKLSAFLADNEDCRNLRESKVPKLFHRQPWGGIVVDLAYYMEVDQQEKETVKEDKMKAWKNECFYYENELKKGDLTLNELEIKRYPGFSMLRIETQLEFVADALNKFPHPGTLQLISLFNLANQNQNRLMAYSPACGNILVIKRLLSCILQVRELLANKDLDNSLPIEAMNRFLADGFQLLGLLSRAQCGRQCILREGGLWLIIDQISQVPFSSRTFYYCCFALGNLISELSDKNESYTITSIAQTGIIPRLINGLRENQSDWKVVKQICFALGNIAYVGDFENVFISEDSIELVLAAMKKHSHEPQLQTETIFFLKNSAFGDAGRQQLLFHGGIELILNAMKNHEQHTELLELSINILFDWSFSVSVDNFMADSSTVEIILRAIVNNSNNTDLLKGALRALLRIYLICNDAQKINIIQAGITKTLIELKTKHHNIQLNNILTDLLFALSQEKITYEKKPENSQPNFIELCAREVLNKNVKMPCSNYLPLELQEYLKRGKRCSCCQRSYFETFWEAIKFVKYPEYNQLLPTLMSMCSVECFDKWK